MLSKPLDMLSFQSLRSLSKEIESSISIVRRKTTNNEKSNRNFKIIKIRSSRTKIVIFRIIFSKQRLFNNLFNLKSPFILLTRTNNQMLGT